MSAEKIRDFIESRDIPLRTKAEALAEFDDIVEHGLAGFSGALSTTALDCAFTWRETHSGKDFWRNVYYAKKLKGNKMEITPAAPRDDRAVKFDSLEAGDCFLYEGELLIKTDDDDEQAATSFGDGSSYIDMCGEYVIPVDVKMKWSFR